MQQQKCEFPQLLMNKSYAMVGKSLEESKEAFYDPIDLLFQETTNCRNEPTDGPHVPDEAQR